MEWVILAIQIFVMIGVIIVLVYESDKWPGW